jgi:Fic family protein
VKRGLTGEYSTLVVGGEPVHAFIPNPVPPKPALDIGSKLREALDQALLALGRLDSVTTLLPDTKLFLYMYVRKEAVLSSRIEGTQSSLSDLLLFELDEAPGVPLDDVVEVSNYVAAMKHGHDRLREGFPLSNRLLREIHGILLAKGRGSDRLPGAFRRSQNWIGGTRPGNAAFVPPPADRVEECMAALERFLHDLPERTPVLLKAAMAHVQFETIHPFLDGNGRVGRLLIPLILCHAKVLREPLLYMSLYLKQHRDRYFELLSSVRLTGDWESWILFFAEGIREMADGAVATARKLEQVAVEDRERIAALGRVSGSALRIHQALQRRPLDSIPRLVRETRLSAPTAASALAALEQDGIVREITGRKRNRLYAYERYLAILREGTDRE